MATTQMECKKVWGEISSSDGSISNASNESIPQSSKHENAAKFDTDSQEIGVNNWCTGCMLVFINDSEDNSWTLSE